LETSPAAASARDGPERTSARRERRLILEDKLARLVQVNFGYKAPPGGHEDSVAFGMLDTILASVRALACTRNW